MSFRDGEPRMPAEIQRLEPRRLLAAGDVDLTFGGAGMALVNLNEPMRFADLAVMPDSRIVAARGTWLTIRTPSFSLSVSRYSPGSTSTTDPAAARCNAAAIDSVGPTAIVAAGTPATTFDGR